MLADKSIKDFEERKKRNKDFFDQVELIDYSVKTKADENDKKRKEQKEKDEKNAFEKLKTQNANNLEVLGNQQQEFLDSELKKEKDKQEAIKAIQDQAFAISKQALDSIATISDMNKQKEIEAAKGNKEKIAAIEKKYFERNKKIQIAQATMATAQAAIQAYQSLVGIPIAGPALAALASAAAIAAGAIQINKIKNTKFEGGGDSSAASTTTPTPSANTTAGGVTGMQAPQQVGQGIANANAINNALNNPNMIRAVVVETDITDSQRRVRGIEDRATFG